MFIGVINNSINNLLSVRGYHACLYLWATIGEVLQAKPEPTNSKHNRAVAVLQDGGMSHLTSLRGSFNSLEGCQQGICRSERGESKPRCTCRLWTGNSMYISYYYYLYSPTIYICRMKELII